MLLHHKSDCPLDITLAPSGRQRSSQWKGRKPRGEEERRDSGPTWSMSVSRTAALFAKLVSLMNGSLHLPEQLGRLSPSCGLWHATCRPVKWSLRQEVYWGRWSGRAEWMEEDLIDKRLLRAWLEKWRSWWSGAVQRIYLTSYPSVDSLAIESEHKREGLVSYATWAASGEVHKGGTSTETCVILTMTMATRWCDSELKERLCVWCHACVKKQLGLWQCTQVFTKG